MFRSRRNALPRSTIGRIPWRIRRQYALINTLILLPLMIGVVLTQAFEQTQLWVTNLFYVPTPTTDQIVMVAIDDLSLGAFGRSVSGWSRERHATLLRQLTEAGARVVVFDVVFDTPSAEDSAFATAIDEARRGSAGTRVVLAVSGGQGSQLTDNPGEPLRYGEVFTPISAFQSGVALGHVNALADVDGYVRSMPMQIGSEKGEWLSLSAAAYLSYLRIPPTAYSQVVKFSSEQLTLTPRRIVPVDSGRRMRLNFFGPTGTFRTYSYLNIHDGEFTKDALKDRIVLVGLLNATGVTDRYLVPIERGNLMAGVEIHANALETLLQGKALTEQPQGSVVAMMIGIMLVSPWVLIAFRPRGALIVYLTLIGIGFVVASVVFSTQQFVVRVTYPALGLTLVLLATFISNIQMETARRRQVQSLLDGLARLAEEPLMLNDVLPQLAKEISTLTGSTSVAIWLWNDDHQQVQRVYETLKGILERPTGFNRLNQPAITNSWNSYDLLAQEAAQSRTRQQQRSALIIPLIHQRGVVGALSAATPPNGSFSVEKIELLEIFAENSAPILANSRLYTSITQQKELIESILTSSPDPILVLDPRLRLIRTNPAAQQTLTLLDEAPRPLVEVFTETKIDQAVIDQLRDHLDKRDPFEQEISIGERQFKFRAAPLTADQGAWVIVLNDISTLKELDALKTQMIRMASHDLKNPLSIVMGYTELMMTGRVKDADKDRFIKMIDDAAKRMFAIITDILNIERLRAGRLDLSEVDLSELVAETAEEYRTQAEEKQQTLTLHRPRYAVQFQLDRRQMHEALSNLIGNAIKYTPKEGAVTIRLEEHDGRAKISIQDTGYGISKEAQANLFRPFYRVKTKQTASIPGTGLGLSLVKAVIEAHGGRITIQSEEGKGSTFYIDLPVRVT